MSRLARLGELRLALILVATIAVIWLPVSRTDAVREIEGSLLDLRFRLTAEKPPSTETLLVLIDERSLRQIGRWPWSRARLAELIGGIAAARPRAIGLDLLLPDPELAVVQKDWIDALQLTLRQFQAEGLPLNAGTVADMLRGFARATPGDLDLAATLEQAGNVVLPASFGFQPLTSAADQRETPESLISSAISVTLDPDLGDTAPEATSVLAPIEPIGSAVRAIGHANVGLDPGGAARFEYPVVAYEGEHYPSFALQVARLALGIPKDGFRLEVGRSLGLGDALTLPLDQDGRVLLGYERSSRFPQISAADVFAGEVASSRLADRIVLIGGNAAGLGRSFPSPFAGGISGIERHAMVVDDILSGDIRERLANGTSLNLAFVLFGGLVIGFATRRARAAGALIATLSLITLLVAGNFALFLKGNLWLDLFMPVAALVLLGLLLTSYRYVVDLRQQRDLRKAFGQYLNPELVDRVVQDPSLLRLGGEERVLTVLFADLRNSTGLAAALGPATFVRFLNDVFSMMTGAVFQHTGMLDKYVGDGIIAVFGAPLAREDHALLACQSALAIQAGLPQLQEAWRSPGGPPIEIGIGINTGPMIIGNMGSAERFDYTVIGDEASLGARLEAANKDLGTRILISQATFQKAADGIEARSLGELTFRGIPRPVNVYELLSTKSES